jgi:hypothetical protein
MGIYGIAHELQQGGDVPVVYDNTAEYYDACEDEWELMFCCDVCGEVKHADHQQPKHVYEPTVDVLVMCFDCFAGPFY